MEDGLKRIAPFLSIDPDRVVIVAGTNGKGSVSATLEQLLLSTGQSVGLYTSPHLVLITERFRIHGEDISPESFCQAHDAVLEKVRDLSLSQFEMLTLMAAWIFFSGSFCPKVDWAIFEVGLGGIWDATNAIPHRHSVITRLGKDHEALLGKTLPEIAANKFGIIGQGAKVTHFPVPSPEVTELAQKTCQRLSASCREAKIFPYRVEQSSQGPISVLQTSWGEAPIALPGLRGAENTSIALATFEQLGFAPKPALSSLVRVRWPGRMERASLPEAPCPIYFSGDHNPQGIQSLMELLPSFPRKRLHVLVGVGKEKDLEGILGPLFELKNRFIYLTQVTFRGRDLDSYGPWLDRCDGSIRNPAQAFQTLLQRAEKDDLILVTGSLYLVGEIKEWIQKR
jgi:dihydrofolate synthase/folylpolyglutamate synthase